MAFQGVPRRSKAFQGIPWHSKEFHGVPRHFMAFHSIPWRSMVFQGVPWHSNGSDDRGNRVRALRLGTYGRKPYAFVALGQGPMGPELVFIYNHGKDSTEIQLNSPFISCGEKKDWKKDWNIKMPLMQPGIFRPWHTGPTRPGGVPTRHYITL